MRIKIILIVLLAFPSLFFAQVGIGTTTPDASAKLEVKASNKGFLPPRVALTSTSDAATITTPATGLFVYNTATAGTSPSNVSPGFYYYDGSKWQRIINQQPDATVEFNQATPTTAGVAFTPNTPASKDYVYVSTTDNSQWTYNGTTYVTYTPPASTAWYLSGGTTDAGSNKTSGIVRSGKVGIGSGITTPSNIVEISGTGGTGTGLKLTTGAASGRVLTSDISGNVSWQTSNTIVYTEIHCNDNSGFTFASGAAFNRLHAIKADNVVSLYGSSYGWNDAGQKWVAPFTGKYRVTTNVYFNSNPSYANPRLYGYVNNSTVCNITSAPNGGNDSTSNTSAIIQLNQGDYINWKIQGSGAHIYCGEYHTFVRIESVGQ
jgi:hypothetical protein